jgi:hypothetical protein
MGRRYFDGILYMEKHTIRLTVIIGLGWLCFLESYLDQTSTAKTVSFTGTSAAVNTALVRSYLGTARDLRCFDQPPASPLCRAVKKRSFGL